MHYSCTITAQIIYPGKAHQKATQANEDLAEEKKVTRQQKKKIEELEKEIETLKQEVQNFKRDKMNLAEANGRLKMKAEKNQQKIIPDDLIMLKSKIDNFR